MVDGNTGVSNNLKNTVVKKEYLKRKIKGKRHSRILLFG